MPIRFRCAYCNQLMGIARRKAGTVVRCPNCAGEIVVPNIVPDEEEEPSPKTGKPKLFERSDFDRVFDEATGIPKPGVKVVVPGTTNAPAPPGPVKKEPPEPEQIKGPPREHAKAPPPEQVKGPPPSDKKPIPTAEPAATAVRKGIVLSPSLATGLAVGVVLALALAFALGLWLGFFLRNTQG